MSTAATPARSGLARWRWFGPLLLVIGGALALIASGRVWATVGAQTFTGQQTTGGLLPTLGWTALVLSALLLVVGRLGRRLVAVLALLLAAGQLVTAFTRRTPPSRLLGGETADAVLSQANLLLAGAGLVVALGGLLIWATAGAWPDRAQRYSRSGRNQGEPDPWKAMDAGQDPTDLADPTPEPDPAAEQEQDAADPTEAAAAEEPEASHPSDPEDHGSDRADADRQGADDTQSERPQALG